jgi:two-component system cell cycle response regulator
VRILVADDDRTSRTILARALTSWGYEVVTAADGDEAFQVMDADDAPPLAVLDWMMPGLDGVDVCRRIRAAHHAGPPYLILLTARDGKDDLANGLDAGADDYVSKPFDAQELKARMEVGRRFVSLYESLLQTQRAMEHLAMTDALTGVLNRGAIMARLEDEVARATRERSVLSLGILDIDRFKDVNDVHGHLAGDSVLRDLVVRVGAVLRPYDLLGRYGGEEFLIVAPNADLAQAGVVFERVRAAVAARPFVVSDGPLRSTVSVGGTSMGAGDSADELLSRADEALYRAKAHGRDRVEMAGRVSAR